MSKKYVYLFSEGNAGMRELATTLTIRARDLVGAPAAAALIELIHEADAAEPEAGE